VRLARDQSELVLRSSRADFVRMHEHPFLVGSPSLRKPAHAHLTAAIPLFDPATLDSNPIVDTPPEPAVPLVLPIRKRQNNFPSMITVGRTENNDLALPDITVSRFHAFFRHTAGSQGGDRSERLELADAGSRNGTWLAGRRLPGKGPLQVVTPGDVVRFGNLSFIVLDAGGCWDELHKVG
jgi:pSer/pThr/pTyr-binding forkhead associated (FHA) protein